MCSLLAAYTLSLCAERIRVCSCTARRRVLPDGGEEAEVDVSAPLVRPALNQATLSPADIRAASIAGLCDVAAMARSMAIREEREMMHAVCAGLAVVVLGVFVCLCVNI